MIQRLYVHNFRCLENFELNFKDLPATLLVGKNGTGKSTVAAALEILQGVGRGTSRIGQLVGPTDFAFGRSDVPMRFEAEVVIGAEVYTYTLALELPMGFRELRINEESLTHQGKEIYSRKVAQVVHATADHEAKFIVDWHLVALPIIQVRSEQDPVEVLRTWLARMMVLAPLPSLITGESGGESLEPTRACTNLGDWFTGLMTRYPAAYKEVEAFFQSQGVMRDLSDIRNEVVAKNSKNLVVRFAKDDAKPFPVDFKCLSDGEKCFFVCALALAANRHYGPLCCFWDEPESYLSLSEVSGFVAELRRAFKHGGQLVATSHNPEAIRRFSAENTLVLDRKGHLEPTQVRLLAELPAKEDLVEAMILGDLEL